MSLPSPYKKKKKEDISSGPTTGWHQGRTSRTEPKKVFTAVETELLLRKHCQLGIWISLFK